MTFQILDASGHTTNVLALSVNAGTVLTQSVPTDASGTAMVGQRTMANSLPVVLASDQNVVSAVLAGGTATISGALPAGTNVLGTVTALQAGTWTISIATATSAAVVATSAAVAPIAVKASSGTLYGFNLFCNSTSYPVFLRLYNSTVAGVNGTSVPQTIIGIPSNAVNNGPLPLGGVSFSNAISYQITKLGAANDTTAVAANDLLGWITYF